MHLSGHQRKSTVKCRQAYMQWLNCQHQMKVANAMAKRHRPWPPGLGLTACRCSTPPKRKSTAVNNAKCSDRHTGWKEVVRCFYSSGFRKRYWKLRCSHSSGSGSGIHTRRATMNPLSSLNWVPSRNFFLNPPVFSRLSCSKYWSNSSFCKSRPR